MFHLYNVLACSKTTTSARTTWVVTSFVFLYISVYLLAKQKKSDKCRTTASTSLNCVNVHNFSQLLSWKTATLALFTVNAYFIYESFYCNQLICASLAKKSFADKGRRGIAHITRKRSVRHAEFDISLLRLKLNGLYNTKRYFVSLCKINSVYA